MDPPDNNNHLGVTNIPGYHRVILGDILGSLKIADPMPVPSFNRPIDSGAFEKPSNHVPIIHEHRVLLEFGPRREGDILKCGRNRLYPPMD